MLVTNISIENKTLVIHDPKDHLSTCGAWFRAIMSKMGWSFTWMASLWNSTRFRYMWLPCRHARNAMVSYKSTHGATPTVVLDILCKRSPAFWRRYKQLAFYSEYVSRLGIYRCFGGVRGAGGLGNDGGWAAAYRHQQRHGSAIHGHQYMASSLSNSASGPSSTSNDPQPPHPSTRKKCGTSKGTTGATPQTTLPPTRPTRRIPKSRKANMPPRTRTCEPPPYRSHRQPPLKSGQEGDPTSRNHSSKKRSSNSESGPRSKKSRTPDHEESNTTRKRSTSSRPSDSTCQEPPTAKQRQQKRPVNHATLSEKEIKKWLILITDDNLSPRQHHEHALHFLGAADSTLVTLRYCTLSLQLHPDKNPSDALAKQRFQVLGCARDMFR